MREEDGRRVHAASAPVGHSGSGSFNMCAGSMTQQPQQQQQQQQECWQQRLQQQQQEQEWWQQQEGTSSGGWSSEISFNDPSMIQDTLGELARQYRRFMRGQQQDCLGAWAVDWCGNWCQMTDSFSKNFDLLVSPADEQVVVKQMMDRENRSRRAHSAGGEPDRVRREPVVQHVPTTLVSGARVGTGFPGGGGDLSQQPEEMAMIGDASGKVLPQRHFRAVCVPENAPQVAAWEEVAAQPEENWWVEPVKVAILEEGTFLSKTQANVTFSCAEEAELVVFENESCCAVEIDLVENQCAEEEAGSSSHSGSRDGDSDWSGDEELDAFWRGVPTHPFDPGKVEEMADDRSSSSKAAAAATTTAATATEAVAAMGATGGRARMTPGVDPRRTRSTQGRPLRAAPGGGRRCWGWPTPSIGAGL